MPEISAGLPQNETSTRPNRTHSKFPLTYKNLLTERFGELTPHWVMEGVEDDSLPYVSEHDVRSYTLKAPLMEDITMHKDYYMVPKEAILPLNWSKFYKNPVQGDDIDPLEVGCNVNLGKYAYILVDYVYWLAEQYANDPDEHPDYLTPFFRILPVLEYFFSRGSLLNILGAKGLSDTVYYQKTSVGKTTQHLSFDIWIDAILSEIAASFNYLNVEDSDGVQWTVRLQEEPSLRVTIENEMSLRQFIEQLREDSRFDVVYADVKNSHNSELITIMQQLTSKVDESFNYKVSLFRLWAYQMVVSQYYTNEQVDYIYNADLFREYIMHCVKEAYGVSYATQFESDMWFDYNGIKYQYDYLSAHWFNKVFDRFVEVDQSGDFSLSKNCLPYIQALFSIRRSLRFVDYFTGARSHPLAVAGNGLNISPSSDVIDITRNIQAQRFLNAVNRTVRKFSDSVAGYVKGLFGINQAPDYHFPFYLASTADKVFTVENENTGEAQMSESFAVTTVLRSNSSRYVFEFHPDRRCVMLGITWFDIPRAYINSTEKQFFHQNRYDMFNTYLQYTGDVPLPAQCKQAVNAQGESNYNVTFGYTSPYMEYKQRFNQASGGFCLEEALPGWAFLADEGFRNYSAEHISPNYIRSSPSELDKFYISLTGYSLATYFHFAIVYTNKMDAVRPMAFDPQIVM